jgi:hypothetical protein
VSGTLTIGDVVKDARIQLNDPAPSGSGSTFSSTATNRVMGDVVFQARGLLNDTNPAAYRYPEVDLYAYLADALSLLRRFRVDLFETGYATPLPLYTPADAGTKFPVDEVYFVNFLQYVVSAAQARDDTTAQDQKAAALAQGFMSNLQSLPFRYADSYLFDTVNNALLDARRLRPDLFHCRMRLPIVLYTPADAAVPFPIELIYYTPVVDYVVGAAAMRNREVAAQPPAAAAAGAKPPDYYATFAQRLRTV